jgi:hypothetical protein
MGWNTYVKTIGGRRYLYRQRSYRVPGLPHPRTEGYSLGRVDGPVRKKKPSRVREVGMAIFGVEDEFAQRVDSLWNRTVNKEKEKPASKEAGEAGKGNLSDAGNGEETSEE